MDELDMKKARDLAVIAKELQECTQAYDAFELLMEGIKKVPDQLQMMVDHIVVLQKQFPMPRDGWNAFIKDLQYTNRKHGLNLRIKPELLEE